MLKVPPPEYCCSGVEGVVDVCVEDCGPGCSFVVAHSVHRGFRPEESGEGLLNIHKMRAPKRWQGVFLDSATGCGLHSRC